MKKYRSSKVLVRKDLVLSTSIGDPPLFLGKLPGVLVHDLHHVIKINFDKFSRTRVSRMTNDYVLP